MKRKDGHFFYIIFFNKSFKLYDNKLEKTESLGVVDLYRKE